MGRALTLSEWIGPESVAADPGLLGTRSFTSSSSLRDRQDHREGNKVSRNSDSRNSQAPEERGSAGAEIIDIQEWQFRERFAAHLEGSGKSDKELARIFDVTPPTIRNWRKLENAPTAFNMLRGAYHIPELKGEVRRLLAMESDLDPVFAQEMNRMVSAWMRRT